MFDTAKLRPRHLSHPRLVSLYRIRLTEVRKDVHFCSIEESHQMPISGDIERAIRKRLKPPFRTEFPRVLTPECLRTVHDLHLDRDRGALRDHNVVSYLSVR
jgi:hypothetical protein